LLTRLSTSKFDRVNRVWKRVYRVYFRNEFASEQLGEGEQTLKLGRVSELTHEFDYHECEKKTVSVLCEKK